MHAPAASPPGEASRADDPPAPSRSEDSDLFEYLGRGFPSEAGHPNDTDQPEPALSSSVPPDEPLVEDSEEAAREVGPQDPVGEPPEDFDSQFRSFLQGTLDGARIIALMDRAFDEERMAEMKRLLVFEPANLGEEIARKYQLARYYLATDQPLSALVALKSVQPGALSKEERRTFLLRIADCYRELHNYEAAHGVYLRVMSEHPGDSDTEAAARTNYAKYIEAAAGVAPTLEKLTNL